MERVEDLLKAILDELKALRADVNEIQEVLPSVRPFHDADEQHSALLEIKDALTDLGDRITGSIDGVGGKDLDDLHHAIETLDLNVQGQ